jgi:hypothetical protein
MTRTPRAAWITLALLLGLAGWLRLDRLGEPSFDVDEYLHVFAAQSLNAAGEPALPSGETYHRGMLYTRLVAGSFQALGVSETAARLPSALLDLCVLLVLFLAARRWCSTGAALLAVGLLGLCPWWITEAKNARMYTLFHLGYYAAAWGAWQALEGAPIRRRWLWAMMASACLMVAMRQHSLAMNLLPAIAAFIAVQALAAFARPGGPERAARLRWYGVLLVMGVAAVILAAATSAPALAKLWQKANQAPGWAAGSRYDWGYYLRQWWAMYPLLILLYPVAIARLIRRRPAVGWFLLCLGLVPFGLHSIVYDWKRLRYALYVLPWLVIPAADLLARASSRLFDSGGIRPAIAGGRWWRIAALAAVVLATVHPWLWQVKRVTAEFPSPPWRQAYAWLRPQLGPEDAVLASMPLATLYYLGRPASYVMNNVHIKEGAYTTRRGGHGFLVDGYSGQPMVTTLEELERVVAAHPRGWILIDRRRFQGKTTMTPEMFAYLQARLEPVAIEAAGRGENPVILYRWDRQARSADAAGREGA